MDGRRDRVPSARIVRDGLNLAAARPKSPLRADLCRRLGNFKRRARMAGRVAVALAPLWVPVFAAVAMVWGAVLANSP